MLGTCFAKLLIVSKNRIKNLFQLNYLLALYKIRKYDINIELDKFLTQNLKYQFAYSLEYYHTIENFLIIKSRSFNDNIILISNMQSIQ